MRSIDHQAYLFRIQFGITVFPLDYKSILLCLKNNGFIIKTYIEAQKEIEEQGYSEYAQNHAAFTVVDPAFEKHVIYIDDTLSFDQKAKVLLHEVGHIYLDHTYRGIMGNPANDQEKTTQEEEADQFSISVSAPPCVMKQWGITTIEQLCDIAQLTPDDAVMVSAKIKQLPDYPELPIEKMLCDLMDDPRKDQKSEKEKESNFPKIKKFVMECCLITASVVLVAIVIRTLFPALADQSATSLQSSILISSSQEASSGINSTMSSDTTTSQSNAARTTTEPPRPNPVSQYTPQYTKSSSWVYTYPSKPNTPPSGVMVCVTQAGDKYHLEGCPHLSGRSYAKMDRSTAKDEGLEPCLTCSPDSARY